MIIYNYNHLFRSINKSKSYIFLIFFFLENSDIFYFTYHNFELLIKKYIFDFINHKRECY